MGAKTFPAAVVTAVHDGDTLDLAVDLGFYVTFQLTARLAGMNAIELAMPGGVEARAHLLTLCPVGARVSVTVLSVDKYGGRYDCLVLAGGVDLSARMIADGYAAFWNGKGPKPVPVWPLP